MDVWGIRMTGLRYWVAGSGEYRNLGGMGVTLDNVLSLDTRFNKFLLCFLLDHIYHLAILVSFEFNTVLFYNYIICPSRGE